MRDEIFRGTTLRSRKKRALESHNGASRRQLLIFHCRRSGANFNNHPGSPLSAGDGHSLKLGLIIYFPFLSV